MKRWMTVLIAILTVAAGSLTVSSAAIADSQPAQELDDATEVLQQFVNIPENKIPTALLRQAYGIAVIPSVFKISFIGGVEHGRGVLSVRTADGKWSDPAFVSMTGGSVGFQAGVSSTDVILVFKTQRSIDRIANGQIKLGADASVAAGPVGRQVGASTNMDFNAEVYSYSRSRGLFAGIALGGAHIGIDHDADWLFYKRAGIKARTLLTRDSGRDLPKPGRRFVYTLNQYMPPSNDQFHYTAEVPSQNQGQNSGSSTGAGSANGGDQGYGQTSPYQGAGGSGVTVQQQNSMSSNHMSGNASSQQGNTSDYSGDYDGDYGSNGADRSNPPDRNSDRNSQHKNDRKHAPGSRGD